MHLCTTCTHECGSGIFKSCSVRDWDITVHEPDDHINWCEDYEVRGETKDVQA